MAISDDGRPGRPGALTITVIVTNHDYGHFLAACLDSLHHQHRPAEQILVVDDASTDASAGLLAGRADVETIRLGRNGGQAAAFNAGFAAARGDLVLFLDADDRLAPEALAVIARLWPEEPAGLAGLAYELETIDADGRPLGHYGMRAAPGDASGRLVRHLAVDFMPTSGNVFDRRAIAWAFPLPEPGWKISADALLIRVALMSGPIAAIPQTLGAYRIHGQNGYFRDGLGPVGQARRGSIDIAKAGLDLVRLGRRKGAPAGLRAASGDLLLASARCQMIAVATGAPTQSIGRHLRQALLTALQCGVGPGKVAVLAGALATLPFSRRFRDYSVLPQTRPRGLQALVQRLAGPVARHPDATFSDDPVTDLPARIAGAALARHVQGRGWYQERGSAPALCAGQGDILFARRIAGPAWLGLDLELLSDGEALSLEISVDGGLAAVVELSGRMHHRLLVASDNAVVARAERIGLRLRPKGGGSWLRRARRAFDPVPAVVLHALTFEPAPMPCTGQVLPVGALVPWRDGAAEDPGPDGPQEIVAAPPAIGDGADLVLLLSADQADGWLDLHDQGALCFSGKVGAGSRIVARLVQDTAADLPVTLAAWFRPDDAFDSRRLHIAAAGWQPQVDLIVNRPTLLFGERRTCESSRDIGELLGSGWDATDGEPVLTGSRAELRFALAPHDAEVEPVLTLDFEPVNPVAPGHVLLVAAAINGSQAAVFGLTGDGSVDLALKRVVAENRNWVAIELSVSVRGPGGQDLFAHGGVRLVGIALGPARALRPAAHAAQDSLPDTDFARALLAAAAAESDGLHEDLPAHRQRLKATVAGLSDRGALALLTPGALGLLARVGAHPPWDQTGQATDPPDDTGAGPGRWLRNLALLTLSGPAFRTCPDLRLTALPPLTVAYTGAVAAYLAADLPPGTDEPDVAEWRAWFVRLLRDAKSCLVARPKASPARDLAEAMLANCRPNRQLFTGLALRPFAESFGEALEALLLGRGHRLALPQDRPAGGKRRLALLVRQSGDLPELRIMRAFLQRLPLERFDLTVFFVDAAAPVADLPGEPRLIGLEGQSIGSAVELIRSTAPDILFLGSFFLGYDRMTLIAAHRLAPRQLAFSAISPVTTGLSATTGFVAGKDTMPVGAEADYVERIVPVPGLGQMFAEADRTEAEPAPAILTRHRLGISEGSVLMVSGAMLDKIGSGLLDAWMQILARCPGAVLALYPFAQNWNRAYDARLFEERLASACATSGVARDRLRLIAPMARAQVRSLLAAADLYLDSFPYAGATTTVEALGEGLPVVSLAGQTQRGHQSAAWVGAFGAGAFVAQDVDGYVATAVDLALRPSARLDYAARLRAQRDRALRQDAFAQALADLVAPPAPDPVPRYLFHHLPKSGGTSVRKMLGKWFDIVGDYRAPWAETRPAPRDLAGMGPDSLLSGHFAADGMPLSKRYPETADPVGWRRIVFLRDPLDLALSTYFFEKNARPAHDPRFVSPPLGVFLRTYPGAYLQHFECDPGNWREILEGYWFIGTMERLPDCMAWLAEALKKPPQDLILHENVTPRDEEPAPEDIAEFSRNMAHEFAIYRWASDRLSRTIGEQPLDQLLG